MEEYGVNFQEPPPDLIKGEEEWEVEQILNEHKQGTTKQYLICWKGYSNAHDSWEPTQNIHAPDLIKAFQERKARTSKGIKEGKESRKRRTVHL